MTASHETACVLLRVGSLICNCPERSPGCDDCDKTMACQFHCVERALVVEEVEGSVFCYLTSPVIKPFVIACPGIK